MNASERNEIEQAKERNREVVLNMLLAQKSVTNKEFTKAQIGRFGASIKELRMEGYIISKVRIPESNGTVEYSLVGKGEPVPQVSALEKLQNALINMGYENLAESLVEVLENSQVTVRNKPIY